MGHNKNARAKPYSETDLQWTRNYQQDFTDEEENNQSEGKNKQSYTCSVLFHHCSLALLTWFKNMKYFILKEGANIKSINCYEFSQLLFPENNRNVSY